jgi:hypothetical protein
MAVPQMRCGLWFGAESEDAVGGFVEADDDLGAADEQRAADEVWVFGHELDGVGSGRRILGHVAFTVEFVAGVEKIFVIAFGDELLEFGFRKRLFIEIAGIEIEF